MPLEFDKADENSNDISTGHLPTPDVVQVMADQAHASLRSNDHRTVSLVYPALAEIPRDLFGMVGTSGNIHAAGDTEFKFSITSMSKSFVGVRLAGVRA